MRFKYLFLLTCLISCVLSSSLVAQTGIIKGHLYNEINHTALPFATVILQGTNQGIYTDSIGNFELKNLTPGLYNLEIRATGFKTETIYEIQVSNSKPYMLEIGLKEADFTMDSVQIVASPFKQKDEAPLSLHTIGENEIKRYPGGNRDISRVIQALPGVGSTISFRNDILIRGGAPNENRFYIDGIETPNINHFATQGASGGPVGLINVDFIGEVDFYSGAFPANRGNALSSVFEFKQRAPRDDRIGFTATVGASDLALTLEGPSGKNSSFLFSARRSYLQLLFKTLDLPFLPTYNDFQYKHQFKIGNKHEINLVGLAAIDEFALNEAANETEYQRYVLNSLPVNTQWNYTFGVNYKHFGDQGFWMVVASRNMINFDSEKFENNIETNRQLLDYNSQEIENKLRLEYTTRQKGIKWTFAQNFDYVQYTNSTYVKSRFGTIDFDSELDFYKYGVSLQASKDFLQDRLMLSFGVRTDANSFSNTMSNPFEQISPRLSASYRISSELSLNFNTGIFYQLPPYTVLGYRNSQTNELENLDVTYIQNKQIVGGLSYILPTNTKISVESYFKRYDNYPFLLLNEVSLGNLGGDFGVIGNEPASSTSEGRTYGVELLVQQRLFKGFYGILSYTLGRSEFTDKEGDFVPSAWDSRHILSITAGKKLKKDWEVGARWRLQSGTPYTPANLQVSTLREVWDARGTEVPNYDKVNSERIPAYHQLDIRIDKKWYYQKFSLDLYLDIQNLYQYIIPGPPILTMIYDINGRPKVNPNDPTRYESKFLENDLGIFQPSVGVVFTY